MTSTAQRGPPYLGRRLLIFVLVGIPLGSMLFMLALPLMMTGTLELGSAYTEPTMLPALVLLPPFWMVGAVPALVCAGIDAKLAGTALAQHWRTLLSGAFGGAVALVPVIGLYISGLIGGPLPLLVGLASMGAAIACSVLSALADKADRRTRAL